MVWIDCALCYEVFGKLGKLHGHTVLIRVKLLCFFEFLNTLSINLVKIKLDEI